MHVQTQFHAPQTSGRHHQLASPSQGFEAAPPEDQALINNGQAEWGPDPITPTIRRMVTGAGVVVGAVGGGIAGHFSGHGIFTGAVVGAVAVGAAAGVAAHVFIKNSM